MEELTEPAERLFLEMMETILESMGEVKPGEVMAVLSIIMSRLIGTQIDRFEKIRPFLTDLLPLLIKSAEENYLTRPGFMKS